MRVEDVVQNCRYLIDVLLYITADVVTVGFVLHFG